MAQSKPCPLREDIDKERLLDFLLRYATTQTSVGVQTNRIVVNTTRIAHAYGYEPTIMTFQRNMTMTLSPVLGDGRHSYRPLDAHPVSGMLQHRHGPLNFFFNAELSRLSLVHLRQSPKSRRTRRALPEDCQYTADESLACTLSDQPSEYGVLPALRWRSGVGALRLPWHVLRLPPASGAESPSRLSLSDGSPLGLRRFLRRRSRCEVRLRRVS